MPQTQPHPPIQAKPRQEPRHWAACAIPTSASRWRKAIKIQKQWCSGAPQVSENLIPSPILCTASSNADSITFSLLYYALCGSVSPFFQSQSPSPFLEPGTCLAGTFTCKFSDIPASRQLQFFPFQFLLIFEALISEMYGIIGLYCLAIYLCLSLCSGLILFSAKSQKKMLPLLLFGYHNSSRTPELLGIAAPRNFVLR